MTHDAKDQTLHLVALAYATAADPERFDVLIKAWDDWCDAHVLPKEDSFSSISHTFLDALGLAKKLEDSVEREDLSELDAFAAPAVLLDASQTVVKMNEPAAKIIDAQEIAAGLFSRIQIAAPLSVPDRAKAVYRIGGKPGQRTFLAIETTVGARLRQSYPEAEKLLLISSLDWNQSFSDELTLRLEISAAELVVARGLLAGQTAQEIAGDVGRSVETIRSHIKALLKKTGARRQTELVQFLTILRHVTDGSEAPEPMAPQAQGVARQVLPAATGAVEISRYGNGRPLLYFTTSSRPEETEEVRAAFAGAGFEVFAPARPGFGQSDTVPGDTNEAMLEALLPDLLDHLPDNPILVGHREGGILAARAAAAMAEQGRPPAGLAMISTGAPVTDVESFRTAPDTERRSFLAAQFAEPALVLGYKTAARLFRTTRMGETRVVRYFYSTSPADAPLLDDPKFYEITRANIAYSFEDPEQIVRDIATWGRDWSEPVRAASRACPVLFAHGAAHNFLSIDALRDFARHSNGMEVATIEGAGQMALYLAPEEIAQAIARLADR